MDLPTVITSGCTLTNQGLWQIVITRAACSGGGLSPDNWYPVNLPADAARREAAAAITICAGCPVRVECLELSLRDWAIGRHGVWGGTVPAEREELRARRVARLNETLSQNRDADQAAS
jgi:WhiB family redox-sensing transcriptional regulator